MHIAIVAGEASGDLLGAELMHAILERCPSAHFSGIAGPRMEAAGCRVLLPVERLSVMGLVEAAGRFLELLPIRRRLARTWLDDRPDLFIGIDAPDFNLWLEIALRRGGIRTVHYVSPAVWAWRAYRVRKIARAVDLMLTLFPFEVDFYRNHGIPVRYVGHPLADSIPDVVDAGAARRELGLPAGVEVAALLPGSRAVEVTRLGEPMIEAAKWLSRRRPRIHFVLPLATPELRPIVQRQLRHAGAGTNIRLLDGQSRTAMAAADVVLLASGTATLEAMLLKRPMVITYRTMALTWAVGRRMLQVEHVGLPNVLAGRALVPELLQEEAMPERLGAAALQWLDHGTSCRRLEQAFQRIHDELRNDASARAAEAVLQVSQR